MNKLLIVDDDVIIRKGLAENISWESNGIELIGTASDGEKALELMDSETPQLIISDIKMPFMDGLQFAGIVRSKYPEIKLIFLTSYDEFEYAKTGIDLKIDEFILKPVDNKALLETAKRLLWDYENDQKVKRQLAESLPLLRSRFYNRLINGTFDDAGLKNEMEFLKIEFSLKYFICIVIKIDDLHIDPLKSNIHDQEKLKLGITNIIDKVLYKNRDSIFFDSERDEIAIFFNHLHSDFKSIQNIVLNFTEEIRTEAERFLRTTVTIGVGMSYKDLKSVTASYREAKEALEFRHIMGRNQVYFFQDTGLPKKDNPIRINSRDQELICMIKIGKYQEALNTLDTIQQDFCKNSFMSLNYIRFFSMEKIMLLFREFGEYYKDDADSINIDLYKIFKTIQGKETIYQIFNPIRELITVICDNINSNRITHQKLLIQRAMKLMQLKYNEEGLSLKDIAQEVCISPTYLSILFKREKKITFSDYLFKIRMKKAIELFQNSDLLVYEVAEKTGYSNPQYFSLCFKKYTGHNPSDFR